MNRLHTIVLLFALLVIVSCTERISGGKTLLVETDSEKGFNYPYYLFIPDHIAEDEALTLIVEPNNSGFVSDDMDKHLGKALRIATRDFYIGNYIARNLLLPLLVPVFPPSESEWKIYTHVVRAPFHNCPLKQYQEKMLELSNFTAMIATSVKLNEEIIQQVK